MNDENSLVSLNQIYKDIPILQQLISTILVALSCGDPKLAVPTMAFYGISVLVDKLKVKRTKTFFDELAKGRISLTPELIEKNEFLHCFFSTYSAAIGTYRKEKIEFFARLLINGINEGLVIESRIDEYERYLKILDDLDYIEILILNRIHELHCEYPSLNKSEERANFEKELLEFANQYNFDKESFLSILIRLERTGCYLAERKTEENRIVMNVGRPTNIYYTFSGKTRKIFEDLRNLIMEFEIQ